MTNFKVIPCPLFVSVTPYVPVQSALSTPSVWEGFNSTRCRFGIKPTKLTVFCTSGIIWAELFVPEVAVVAVDVVVLDVQPPPVAVQGHFCLNWRGKE